jgi:hypothetical protein
LPEEQINLIETGLKGELDYEDIPGADQWKGGEMATRMAAALRGAILQSMEVFREAVVTAVCPTYCELKRSGNIESEALKIAVSVADAVISIHAGFPVPATRTAIYIMRTKVLDQWCSVAE